MDHIQQARTFIAEMADHYRRPCVLWSGGKDSMALLHMVRWLLGEDVPVICWREPWLPEKQAFANRIIAEWNLTVWDWHPFAVSLCKGNGRIDVLNHYSFGLQGQMVLARGIERPILEEPWICGRDTFLARPVGNFLPPWDLAFHGHKNCDIDPTSGMVPLEVDVMATPGTIVTAYPLRQWSDEDVFDYIEEHDVPYDEKRYRRIEGHWQVLPYERTNPDYYPACMRCLDPDEGDWVHCPKLNATINNVSSHARWEKPSLPYCNLRNSQPIT